MAKRTAIITERISELVKGRPDCSELKGLYGEKFLGYKEKVAKAGKELERTLRIFSVIANFNEHIMAAKNDLNTINQFLTERKYWMISDDLKRVIHVKLKIEKHLSELRGFGEPHVRQAAQLMKKLDYWDSALKELHVPTHTWKRVRRNLTVEPPRPPIPWGSAPGRPAKESDIIIKKCLRCQKEKFSSDTKEH